MRDFTECINVEGIVGNVEVRTERHGDFVTVETDSYEGSAMMSLAAAEKLVGVLSRAVAHAREQREAERQRLARESQERAAKLAESIFVDFPELRRT